MKVLLAAGGSGGHIFPALAVWEKLSASGVSDIKLIASKRTLDKNLLLGSGKEAFFLSVNPMPLDKNPIAWMVFSFKFISDMVKSIALIIRIGCDRVVGFGGYSSGATVTAAWLLRRKIILHEQNYVPGRANKILSHICDKLAISFRGSERFFSCPEEKTVFTGNPLRDNVLSGRREGAIKNLGLSAKDVTILVMGGSQGAGFLNRTVSEGISAARNTFNGGLQVIHLTGKSDRERVEAFYASSGVSARVISFLDRIEDAYAAADMAFSRAGASALFELAHYALPMVLVPYPHSMNNQRQNAIYLHDRDAAIIEEESSLSALRVKELLLELLEDPERARQLGKKAKELSNAEAAADMAGEVMGLRKR